MDWSYPNTTRGKKRPRSNSPNGDSGAKLHKSESSTSHPSNPSVDVSNSIEAINDDSLCHKDEKVIMIQKNGTSKRKRNDSKEDDEGVMVTKVARVGYNDYEISQLSTNELQVEVQVKEGSQHASNDNREQMSSTLPPTIYKQPPQDNLSKAAAAIPPRDQNVVRTEEIKFPPQTSKETSARAVSNDTDESIDISVTDSENQDIKSSSSPTFVPQEAPRARPCNVKIISILIIMFLFNIASTFTLLVALFTTPNDTTVKSVASLVILNIIFTHALSTQINTSTKGGIDRHHPHIIPPKYLAEQNIDNENHHMYISDVTLRQFLSNPQGFHLGLSPSFFGFYVYFGALTSFQENVLSLTERKKGFKLLPEVEEEILEDEGLDKSTTLLKSVAGASAGAMAAVQLASGLNPRESAEFASTMTLRNFADPIGVGGILKGNLFEEIMANLLKETKIKRKLCNVDSEEIELTNFQLEDGLIPVAVTVFDLLAMKTRTLKKGCAARAARASACFPLLFQPVNIMGLDNDDKADKKGFLSRLKRCLLPESWCIDGGVEDPHGLLGLAQVRPEEEKKRVVNLVAGTFARDGPLGPSRMPSGINAAEVLSISIENTPICGPHNMANGPRAVQAAMSAINAVLDVPMYYGREKNHFILHIDAKAFVPEKKQE